MTAPWRSVDFACVAILDCDRAVLDLKVSSVRNQGTGGRGVRDRESRIEVSRQYPCTPDTFGRAVSVYMTELNEQSDNKQPTWIPERRSNH